MSLLRRICFEFFTFSYSIAANQLQLETSEDTQTERNRTSVVNGMKHEDKFKNKTKQKKTHQKSIKEHFHSDHRIVSNADPSCVILIFQQEE